MLFGDKKALVDNPAKITIAWTDQKSSKPMTVTGVPKDMFLAFCPSARNHFADAARRNPGGSNESVYDLGTVADLYGGAVRYLVTALDAALRERSMNALPAPYPAPDVIRRLKCLAAVKKLGVARFVEHVWRVAAMDAVRAAGRVTLEEFAYAVEAFGGVGGTEPVLLRHVVGAAVYAELTDGEMSSETDAINRYVTGGPREVAIMKWSAEQEAMGKLEERAKSEQRKERRALAQLRERERWADQQKRLEQARNGERALTAAEVQAMQGSYAGPRIATLSNKLR
ncbi:hypothetical protein SLS58_008440 [Diplodia intermedia]|uniref:Uncharacterized protein n=1 Tax=Diplodia intermedia TaxID=856260 RepID=A0ABR3THM8_9PEZI